MTVTIHGHVFTLNSESDDGKASVWTWEGIVPLCPECLVKRERAVPLVTEGHRVSMSHDGPGESRVVCDRCGWKSALVNS